MREVCDHVKFGAVSVPVDETGHFLDWRQERNGVAPFLEGEYGIPHFNIGNRSEGGVATLDFVEMPDGSILLYSICVHHRAIQQYDIVARRDAVKRAFRLVDYTLDALWRFEKAVHDAEYWEQDSMYFMRAVGAAVGLHPYQDMDDEQLRFGA